MHGATTIDHQGLPGAELVFIKEKQDGIGDVFSLPHPAQRQMAFNHIDHLLGGMIVHGRQGQPGRNTVHRDIMGAQLSCNGLGHDHDAGFGSAVGHGAKAPRDAGGGTYIDNSAEFLIDHGRRNRLYTMVLTF